MGKFNWTVSGKIDFTYISSGLLITHTCMVKRLSQIGRKPFLSSKKENVYFLVKLFNTYCSKSRIWLIKVCFNPVGQISIRFG